MNSVLVSIIIPTFNRKEVLKLTLNALDKQSFKDFEVVIIDDASTDGTDKMMNEFLDESDMQIKYFKKNHAGQGIARNFGIEKAQGKYILFLGDDMIPLPNCLEEHFKIHQARKGIAVLGYTDWHPDLKVTDFMKWLAPCGFGFNYCDIKDPNDVDFGHFYTSVISMEKRWLEKDKFDPTFTGYGFEDIDLGYRLAKEGLKIVYNSKAIVYHYHPVTLEEYCNKSEQIAKALQLLGKKHPDLAKKWIKPIVPVLVASSIVSKIPFLKYLNKKLYFLAQVTFAKYKALKCLKN